MIRLIVLLVILAAALFLARSWLIIRDILISVADYD